MHITLANKTKVFILSEVDGESRVVDFELTLNFPYRAHICIVMTKDASCNDMYMSVLLLRGVLFYYS